MSDDCIFCKIVENEIPSTRIYEDDITLSFMDIAPIVKGHALVIPKKHIDPLTEMDDATLQHMIVVVKRIAKAVKESLNADGVNITQANGAAAGQVVPHVHFHIIPRYDRDGKSFNWVPTEYSDFSEMNDLAARIKNAMQKSEDS